MKPVVMALAIDLVARPMISNYAGWQVTSGTTRADVADTAKLDWDARSQLAKKWVTALTALFADLDVSPVCAQKLAV